jgi:hypothetical protein
LVDGYLTTWLGNTFGGLGSPNCGVNHTLYQNSIRCLHFYDSGAKNQPTAIYDIAVTPDGTVFTTQYYDEGHMTLAMFKRGQIIGWPKCNKTGDPNGGGWAAATNGTYVFIAFVGHEKGDSGISRFKPNGSPANFPGGHNYGYFQGYYKSDDSCTNSVEVNGPTNGAPDAVNAIWGMRPAQMVAPLIKAACSYRTRNSTRCRSTTSVL